MSKKFNKVEAKKKISSLANEASLLMKTNHSINNELQILSDYALLTKNILSTLLSRNAINTVVIVKDLNETKTRLMASNRELNTEVKAIEAKMVGEMKVIDETIVGESELLYRIKEDGFLLENELLIKEAQIIKLKKDVKNMNIIQELEKDIFVVNPDNIENYFRTDNAIYQEELTKESRRNNNEKERINDLNEQLEKLQKKMKALNKNNSDPQYKNKEDASCHSDSDDDDNNIDLDYYDFSRSSQGSNSSDEEDAFIFPNKVQMQIIAPLSLNLPIKPMNTPFNIKALIPSLATIDNNINHQFQLPTQPNLPIDSHHLQTETNEDEILPTQPSQVPKLDLKLIEFNKTKVLNDNNTMDDNLRNSNEEEDNDRIPTAKDDISQSITKMRKDINFIYRKMSKNKDRINSFKRFYSKMCQRYTKLQEKLQKITSKGPCNSIENNKQYDTMVTIVKVKKV